MSFSYKVDEDWDGSGYRALIDQIRRYLNNGQWTSLNIPVLITRRNVFDIVLSTDQYNITLRVRSDNVYLEGYQQGAGEWFEFRQNAGSRQMIANSTPLGFGGGYPELEQEEQGHDPRRQGGSSRGGGRLNIPLGHQALLNAVNALGRGPQQEKNRGPEQQRARHLLVIIQMICEAIRYREISEQFATNWPSTAPASPRMVELQTSWGTLSEAVQRLDRNAPSSARLPLEGSRLGITTVEAAAAILALLLVTNTPKPSPSGAMRAPPVGNPFLDRKGRVLVEVFWLRIDNIDKESPGELFGTVTALDGLGSQEIFKRDRENAESIAPGKYAAIMDLGRSIGAADPFEIRFDLKDRDRISWDDAISQGALSWNTYDPGRLYNLTTSYQVRGSYGSATLNYVVLSEAAQAKIEVIMIDGDAKIYGEITANNGHGVIDLFRRNPRDSYVNIRPRTAVPLSRTIVAVPMTGALRIEAHLTDYDVPPRGDEVANGTAVFTPQFKQSATQSIRGSNGRIEVGVEWS